MININYENVKDGIKLIPMDDNRIRIEGGYFPVRDYVHNKYGYTNQYLSWENASYMFPESGEDEINDYLLYRALQEERKLCVSFYTKDVNRIIDVFSDNEKYDYYVKPANNNMHDGFSYVFVARKGCLTDFIDTEYVEDIYRKNDFSAGYLAALEERHLIDFFNGNIDINGVIFDTYIDTENPKEDKVLEVYGPSALIITGLLYGYPIEITMVALAAIYPSGY